MLARLLACLRERASLVAATAMGAALAGALLMAMLVSAIAEADGLNYMHTGFLSSVVYAAMGALGGFVLGAYAGAGLWWALDRRERDFSPGLVATAILAGGAALFPLGVLVSVALAMLGAQAGWLQGGISAVLQLASPVVAFLAGRWVSRFAFRKPLGPRRRLALVAAVAITGAAAVAAIAVPRHDFPGPAAPLAERRAWGVKTFGRAYERAEQYVSTHPAVAASLGRVQAAGPAAGANRTATSPGELMGTFTIEVVGEKGQGVARLEFLHGSSDDDLASYHFKGSFTGPSGTVELGNP